MSKTRKTILTLLAAGVLLLGTDIVSTVTDTMPAAHAESVRTTKKTRVLARPGEKSRVVTRVRSGTTLAVLSREGRWIKVRANGRTGWITRTSVEPTRQARSSVRKTRRRPFVEGRSRRRGFSGSAPADRVGADAAGEEVIDEEVIDEDAPKKKAPRKRTARRSSRHRSARAEDARDDDDDFVGDDDDAPAEDEADAPEQRTVVVSAEEADLMDQPSRRSDSVVAVEKGQKLTVLDKDGDWILVENPDGDQGWIRSSDVAAASYTYPHMLKRGNAGLGYASLSSAFASDGTGELANYKISTAAMSLSVGGELLYKYSKKYMLGADARYTGTRASPGIRYVDAMGNAADIGFTQHEVSVGASAGYNMHNKYGAVIYARAGYYYSKLGIENVSDFTKNTAYLPSEILSGITVGGRVELPRVTPKIGLFISVDALYPNGKREQTAGLEDGAVSDVFAAWGLAHLSYQWKPNLSIEAIYRYSYAKTEWTGAATNSMRPTGSTAAARKDVGHTAIIGLGKSF